MTDPKIQSRLRIAFLTMRDPNSKMSWSGIPYFMMRALERHCGDVFPVGPLLPYSLKLGNLIGHGVRLLNGRTYLYTHTASLSKKLGKMADRKMSGKEYDVIVAAAASAVVAHLTYDAPIVYLSDTTVQLMLGYYDEFSNVLRSHVHEADQLERQSIQKTSQCVYPSAWAAGSAVKDYGAAPAKVSVVAFGANLENPPARELALRPSKRDRCRLLFVGVSWERKGGDIAVETLLELERMGVKAELTIVGCEPRQPVSHPNLKLIPFLDKNDLQAQARLDQLYQDADFFLLPTRAECYGIVFCEANAYGLPVFSTQTGGVLGAVRDGVNGFLLPLEARGVHFAACIRDVYASPAACQTLRASSRREYEVRLNWDAWGREMKGIIQAAIWDQFQRSAKRP